MHEHAAIALRCAEQRVKTSEHGILLEESRRILEVAGQSDGMVIGLEKALIRGDWVAVGAYLVAIEV